MMSRIAVIKSLSSAFSGTCSHLSLRPADGSKYAQWVLSDMTHSCCVRMLSRVSVPPVLLIVAVNRGI